MSNEMIKIHMLVSSALELRSDIERVARAENFIEDGKLRCKERLMGEVAQLISQYGFPL